MTPVSLQDVANIVTFIAPGYLALQVYAIKYSKPQRDFSRLFIESIVFSVPIVSFGNALWEHLFGQDPVTVLNVWYALLLLSLAVLVGLLCTYARVHWPVKRIAQNWGFGSPDEDFVKTQFIRLDPKRSAVAVSLKDGSVFSGTPSRMSRHSQDGRQYYYFTNIAGYNEKTGKWSTRPGGLIVERSEVLYIETPELIDD